MDKVEVGEIFSITDDNNEEHEVEVLAAVTIEGTDYVAVGFVDDICDETDEDIDVFFMKLDEEGDLSPIESDEEFEKVSSVFDDILADDE